MALSTIGQPFKGKIWYWVEDTYGSGESAVTLPISKFVQNVQIGSGDRHKPLRAITDPQVLELLEQTKNPTLHIEYIPQVGDSLLADVINRNSCGTLQSLAFCAGANTCLTGDDVSYFNVVGCKPSTVRVSGSKDTEYLISVDFETKSVTTDTNATGVEPTALAGAVCAFNIAGEITKSGGLVVDTDHIAFITNSIDVTINHNLSGYTDHDELYKSFLIEGGLDVAGSVDVTLDGGGALHLSEVFDNTSFTLTVAMGGAGAPEITLTDCEWDNTNIPIDVSGEAQMNSCPFTAVPSTITDIVGTVSA